MCNVTVSSVYLLPWPLPYCRWVLVVVLVDVLYQEMYYNMLTHLLWAWLHLLWVWLHHLKDRTQTYH